MGGGCDVRFMGRGVVRIGGGALQSSADVAGEPALMRGIRLHAATEHRRSGGLFDPLRSDTYALAEQVTTIATRAHVISLDEVLDHLVEGRPFPARAVHLSIDEGYLGTLEAAELLDRNRLPWTLFVTVGAVIDRSLPWFVRLADAVSVSTNVLDGDGMLHDLSDNDGKTRFFSRASAVVRGAGANQEEVANLILGLPGMSQPDETRWPFLQIAQVRELMASGVTIGSHATSHVDLVGITAQRLETEVSGSRRRLAAALEQPVRFFAYSGGRHDRRARSLVQQEYQLAVDCSPSVPGQTRYRLGRHDAGHDRLGVDVALGDARRATAPVGRSLGKLLRRSSGRLLIAPRSARPQRTQGER
jgi:peptidoglycan/xylan/chitin deacetylase (PgdA/CDA1 family)